MKRINEIKISNTLKRLGISPSREGYWFLKDSIDIRLNDLSINLRITKDIYPKLSKKYHKKPASIEKAISKSIEKGWNNCDLDFANQLFQNIIAYDKDHPTNNEFITTISEYISLEL